MTSQSCIALEAPIPRVAKPGLSALLPALAMLLGACAHDQVVQHDNGGPAHAVDHDGRMQGYVESSRASDFCPDQQQRRDDERCVVTRGWDYARGITIVRTWDPAGKLMKEENPPGADLSLVPAEQARVEALVRADPRTAPIVNRPGVMIWGGGFVMREPGDPYCDKGSRCIRAFAADDGGNNAILHSVVDLMTDRVVYPDYEPSGNKTAGTPEEN